MRLTVLSGLTLLAVGCQAPDTGNTLPHAGEPGVMFRENHALIPFEDRARRKWDNPVIADLDGDGLQDIIITEHGHRVRVLWNDGERFSGPQDIAFGDLHGIGVTDIDADGRQDVIIAQGGGDGKNPRRPLWFQVNKDRSFSGGKPLAYFEPGRGRAVKFADADQDGVPELVLTGFPLQLQTEGANHLYDPNGEGGFDFVGNLPQAKWLGYRALVTDVNADADPDVFFYGGDNMVLLEGGPGLQFDNASERVLGDLANISHVSSLVEIDFDNDGDLDLFATRARHQFYEETYYDEEQERFAFLVFRQQYQFPDLQVEGDLVIENLQVSYPHFDVFAGADKLKLEFEGDRHGGKDLVLRREEAAGWPEGPLKGGMYIGYLGDGRWRIAGESHSRSAAVVSRVTANPGTSDPVSLPARLLENRDGVFVDVSARAGIDIDRQTTSATAGDFDNNGFVDLAVLNYGDMARPNEHRVYLNQGQGRFVRATDHGVTIPEVGVTGGAVEVFDVNRDGALDLLLSSERGRWRLLENTGADNGNFIGVSVGPSPAAGVPASGAVLEVRACGNLYRRRVGASSAAFAQSMNTDLHIGLGSCTRIDSAQVRWSNGETRALVIDTLNRYIDLNAALTQASSAGTAPLPLSDPHNRGGWVLNTDVSDEFEADRIDEDKWYIVGKFEHGKPVYRHPDKPEKRVWKGRAPSQFSGRNYRLEDGKLILETRWEPDFPFSDEIRVPVFGDPLPYENITTACFIGRQFFRYGYIEIKSKAADAEVSSAFWAIGEQLEIDFFEQFGDHRDPAKLDLDRELWWSLRDWNPAVRETGKPTYTEHRDLGFRVADDFHVYGVEWDENGFKYYVDGELLSEVSADDVRAWARENRDVDADYDGWVATRPISLWLDQETFPWHGLPDSKADLERNSPPGEKDDGVVDFEIEYVRVWQKPPAGDVN